MGPVELSPKECRAIYNLIDQLSGGNPEYAFPPNVGGGPNDIADPQVSACAKIYAAAGQGIPDDLERYQPNA